MLHILRNYFTTGIVLAVPLSVTVWAIYTLWNLADNLLATPQILLFGRKLPGLGVALIIVIVLALGVLGTNLIGRRLIGWSEALLMRLPLVRSFYGTAKQVMGSLSGGTTQAFRQVAVVQFPHAGVYALGFITGEFPGPGGEVLYKVLVPTSPFLSNGYLLVCPASSLALLDVPVEEAVTYVISTGIANRSGEMQARLSAAVAKLKGGPEA